MIVKNESGEDIEVFTKEELDEKQQEALEKYKEEHPDTTEELKQQLADKTAELEKLNNKDYNFSKVREQKKAIEEELKKVSDEISQKYESTISKITGDTKEEILSSLVGDDAELKAKVEFHYNRIKDEVTTKKEIEAKMKDAYFLATKSEESIGNFISSAGVGNIKTRGAMTAEQKEFSAKFGITEEDIKKYRK